MRKTKILISAIGLLIGLALFTQPVYAVESQISISGLPEYMRVDYFKLSYSAISDAILDGNPATNPSIQFYYKRDGEAGFTAFGPVFTSASGQVDVPSSIVVNSERKYFFKVVLDGVKESATETIYDVSSPDPVRDYSKDKIGLTSYRIHWTNPGNSDFRQVFIYRGEAPDFSANDDKKVTGIAGTPDTNMSWDDSGLDPNKTYYYIIRALDKAGNSSGLVGDTYTVQGEAVVTTVTPTQGAEGRVTALPGEEGEVLGEEEGELTATPIPTPSNIQEAVSEAVSRFKSSKLLIGIGVLAFIVGLIWYWASSKKKK